MQPTRGTSKSNLVMLPACIADARRELAASGSRRTVEKLTSAQRERARAPLRVRPRFRAGTGERVGLLDDRERRDVDDLKRSADRALGAELADDERTRAIRRPPGELDVSEIRTVRRGREDLARPRAVGLAPQHPELEPARHRLHRE